MRLLPTIFPFLLLGCAGGILDTTPPGKECPIGVIDRSSLSFTNAVLGAPQTLSIQLSNDCIGTRSETASFEGPAQDPFDHTDEVLTLAPGESREFTIIYTPVDYGPHADEVAIVWSEGHTSTLSLTGQVHPDQDGDGYHALQAGGLDCDDSDPNVYPGHDEAQDQKDNDCDGLIDEDFVSQGDLFISEFMVLPQSTPMEVGQWIELSNTTSTPLYLQGWTLYSGNGSGFTINTPLVLPAKGQVVLAAHENPELNGGVEPDAHYAYADLPLETVAGVIQISLQDKIIAYLEYDRYWPLGIGASISADPLMVQDAYDATRREWWCEATSPMAGGDKGSPGQSNDYCSSVDHDGDGFSEDQGDCLDTDASVYPGGVESWDGRDNDCDSKTDNLVIEDHAWGYVEGIDGEQLGNPGYLGFGDADDDGKGEFLVSSRYGSAQQGIIYALSSEDAHVMGGLANAYATAKITGAVSNQPHHVLSQQLADNDGDGRADLVMMGSGYSYYGTGQPGIAVMSPDRVGLGGGDIEDAKVYIEFNSTSYNSGHLASHLDHNGDGIAEIIYSRSQYGYYTTGLVGIQELDGAIGNYSESDLQVAAYPSTHSYTYLGGGLGGGDMDLDGYDDFVVRQMQQTYGSSDDVLYAVMGSVDPYSYDVIDDVAQFQIDGLGSSNDTMEGTTSQIADFDNDGNPDLAAGSSDHGEVYIFFNVADLKGEFNANDDADVIIESDAHNDVFGRHLTSGDFNADGAADLAISSWEPAGLYGGLPVRSRVLLFNGGDWQTTPPDEPSGTIRSDIGTDALGTGLLSADFNDDGLDDLILGAPYSGLYKGRVYFLGRE